MDLLRVAYHSPSRLSPQGFWQHSGAMTEKGLAVGFIDLGETTELDVIVRMIAPSGLA